MSFPSPTSTALTIALPTSAPVIPCPVFFLQDPDQFSSPNDEPLVLAHDVPAVMEAGPDEPVPLEPPEDEEVMQDG